MGPVGRKSGWGWAGRVLDRLVMAAVRQVEELVEDLRRLGVTAGDTLMVHASLRRIGPVVGRADGVVDALEAAVGPTAR